MTSPSAAVQAWVLSCPLVAAQATQINISQRWHDPWTPKWLQVAAHTPGVPVVLDMSINPVMDVGSSPGLDSTLVPGGKQDANIIHILMTLIIWIRSRSIKL